MIHSHYREVRKFSHICWSANLATDGSDSKLGRQFLPPLSMGDLALLDAHGRSSLEVVTPPINSLPDSPVTPPIGGVSAASSLALKYGG